MQSLVDYVLTRLAAGRSRADILDELVALGWAEGSAESSYREALIALGAPVPVGETPLSTASKVSVGEIVANIFSFILLHVVIWATLVFYFALIDLALFYPAMPSDADALRFCFWMAVLVLAGAGAGYFAVGVPQTARDLAFDMGRVTDLNNLSDCIRQYAAKQGELPASLELLERVDPLKSCAVADANTGEKFGYRIVSPSLQRDGKRAAEFELCAKFAFYDGLQTTDSLKDPNWLSHGAGRSCKRRQVPLLAE